eukprot:scaffold7335_cov417-Prasinococcus_capsulatus_cf.AAC.15
MGPSGEPGRGSWHRRPLRKKRSDGVKCCSSAGRGGSDRGFGAVLVVAGDSSSARPPTLPPRAGPRPLSPVAAGRGVTARCARLGLLDGPPN